jgi:hypothetical protein
VTEGKDNVVRMSKAGGKDMPPVESILPEIEAIRRHGPFLIALGEAMALATISPDSPVAARMRDSAMAIMEIISDETVPTDYAGLTEMYAGVVGMFVAEGLFNG